MTVAQLGATLCRASYPLNSENAIPFGAFSVNLSSPANATVNSRAASLEKTHVR
jgi:hypothetical protein